MNKLTDFRNVFGKNINLFSDDKKDYLEIPRLRKEKNFPKQQKDLKSSFNKLTDTNNLSEEVFATLDQLMGFVLLVKSIKYTNLLICRKAILYLIYLFSHSLFYFTSYNTFKQ